MRGAICRCQRFGTEADDRDMMFEWIRLRDWHCCFAQQVAAFTP